MYERWKERKKRREEGRCEREGRRGERGEGREEVMCKMKGRRGEREKREREEKMRGKQALFLTPKKLE